MRTRDEFDTGDILSGEPGEARGRTLRERFVNAPMNVHRENIPERGFCGVTSRQFERLLSCMGCPAEEPDTATCEELAAGIAAGAPGCPAAAADGVSTARLTGAANPGAAITPPSWRCPLTGEMCPVAASSWGANDG